MLREYKDLSAAKATRTASKTLWKGSDGRLDVENPAPGKRDGQLHFQAWGDSGGKWLYDGERFVDAPKWVNELLDNAEFRAKVDYGWKTFLGMN